MNDLILSQTNSTPGIKFLHNGYMLMEGKSLPIHPGSFYDTLINWASTIEIKYVKFIINLEYINSASIKKIHELLKTLDSNSSIRHLQIVWCYEEDDRDILDNGLMLKEFLKRAKFLILKSPTAA
jgi:hypothetical protein